MPGYTGFVQKRPFGENVGLTYAQVTKQVLEGNVHYGPKDRELDTHAAKDKFVSINQVQYVDEDAKKHHEL